MYLMGASERHVLTKVVLPSAITWVFAGLRISVPYALIGAIVGELIASNRGLGFLLADAFGTVRHGRRVRGPHRHHVAGVPPQHAGSRCGDVADAAGKPPNRSVRSRSSFCSKPVGKSAGIGNNRIYDIALAR